MTPRIVRRPPPRGLPLTQAERVAALAVLLFATAGVLVFGLTLPPGTQFAFGIGWGLVLAEAGRWMDAHRRG